MRRPVGGTYRRLVAEEGEVSVRLIDYPIIKYGFATRAVPLDEMAKAVPLYAPPRIGDLVLAEVQDIGRHYQNGNPYRRHYVPVSW